MRALLSSRSSNSRPGSPRASDGHDLIIRGMPGSPVSSLEHESPSRRTRDWSLSGSADVNAMDTLIRGAVAQEIRELESTLESKVVDI